MKTEGYLKVTKYSFAKDASREEEKDTGKEEKAKEGDEEKEESDKDESQELKVDEDFLKSLSKLKKGDIIPVVGFAIKEGMTSPPKRYNSGSLILAMESAGQFIEDEDLRAQIKGSGIGTSATRAGILTKLVNNKYLNLNKKTQIITPTLLGEMVHDVVLNSIRSLLNPSLTASWEKGLTMVAEGEIGKDEYMNKLSGFVADNTNMVKSLRNQNDLNKYFVYASKYYKHK